MSPHASSRARYGIPGALLCMLLTAFGRSLGAGAAIPVVTFQAPDTVYWLDCAPLEIDLIVTPATAGLRLIVNDSMVSFDADTRLRREEGNRCHLTTQLAEGRYVVVLEAASSGLRARDSVYVVVLHPRLGRTRGSCWSQVIPPMDEFLTAYHGMPYRPSTHVARGLPMHDVHTDVSFAGVTVLSMDGNAFDSLTSRQLKAITVPEGLDRDEIHAEVYWKPGGTDDRSRWRLLLANYPNPDALFPLDRPLMQVNYQATHCFGNQESLIIQPLPHETRWQYGPMQALQLLGGVERQADIRARCRTCDKYGVVMTVRHISAADIPHDSTIAGRSRPWELNSEELQAQHFWMLELAAPEGKDLATLGCEIGPMEFNIELELTGPDDSEPKDEMIAVTLMPPEEE